MEEYDRPFDEKVELFKRDLSKIASDFNIPVHKLLDQFSFRFAESKIWYIINDPADEDIIEACIKLYRLYFPDGQGRYWETRN